MRTEIIERRLRSILGRLAPPRSIAKNADAQSAEVAAMRKAINAACPTQGMDDWLDQFEENLFSQLETRAWPTLREVKRAARVKRDQPVVQDGALDAALMYFNTNEKPHPVFNSPEITAEIIRRGMVQDIRDARWRGLKLTSEQSEQAKRMRPTRAEWEHHVGLMAYLSNVSFQDAEAREIQEISQHQLPLHHATAVSLTFSCKPATDG